MFVFLRLMATGNHELERFLVLDLKQVKLPSFSKAFTIDF